MRRTHRTFSARQRTISAFYAENKGTFLRIGQKAIIGEATVHAMSIDPGLWFMEAQVTHSRICLSASSSGRVRRIFLSSPSRILAGIFGLISEEKPVRGAVA